MATPTDTQPSGGFLDRIVSFSVRNRYVVIFFVLLFAVVGLRALDELPIDVQPDVTNVQVQVLTNSPALGPLEVERFITFPVEAVMSGLPSVDEIRSISRFGLSSVTIVFEDGTDLYWARQLVQERLSEAREAIPAGYGSPSMGPISSGMGEIYQFEVKGEPTCGSGPNTEKCYTPMELRSTLDWYLAYQLRNVRGVVEVNSFGGELKTYEVQVNPARLRAFDLGLNEIFEALEKNNLNAGGAYIAHGGEQRLIRGEGLIHSLDDIRNIVVDTREDGTPIRIGEVAEVDFAPMVRQGAVTRDGRGEVVTGIVMMLIGGNSGEVADAVDEKLEELKPGLPEGVTIDTYYDRTKLVERTTHTIAKNLIEGAVFVLVILLLLLGNLRGGLLVASIIPLSFLGAVIGMNALGISGNLMSLGALDFGLIVDGAVVVIENTVRMLSERRAKGAEATSESTYLATSSVARPVVFAVAIIILVYVPILSLRGIEGKMFQPMAVTVILALVTSLILTFTFMPAMSSLIFRKGVSEKEPRLVEWLKRLYGPSLAAVMRRRGITLGVAGGVFVLALVTATQLGAVFVPTLDEGAIAMQSVRLPSVSLEESIAGSIRIEKVMMEEFPDEVDTIISRTGRAEIATDPMGVEISDVYMMLHPKDQWTRADSKEELVSVIDETLQEKIPGQNYAFSQPIELRTNELISGARSDIAISLYGEDLDLLKEVGEEIMAAVREVPGAADISADQVAGLPFLTIDVDTAALSRYGLSAADVMDVVSSIGGYQVGEVFEGQKRFALQVRLDKASRGDVTAIRRIPVRTSTGLQVPLEQVADIRMEEGPASINRENVQRRLVIQTNVRGRDIATFVADAKAAIAAQVDLPSGYFLEWGGQFKNLQEATGRLAIAVPASLALIFLLLFMAFGSARPAAIIYLNIPFAAAGGVFALFARGLPFSVSAAVGFIALFGIAVMNGVVMVQYIRDLQDEGLSLKEATVQGALTRMRPVLMTAAAAALGFLPMAISGSAGAEVQRPLASVVIGGLITATFLTLFVLPIIYSRFGEETVNLET